MIRNKITSVVTRIAQLVEYRIIKVVRGLEVRILLWERIK